jgi:P27 family predicted phage terminase small subunit
MRPKVTKPPLPPDILSGEAKRLWRSLVKRYDIKNDAQLMLLGVALECYDTMTAAKRLLRRDGPTIADRFGAQKAHPALAAERSARNGLISALQAMNIDLAAAVREPVAARRAAVRAAAKKSANVVLLDQIFANRKR